MAAIFCPTARRQKLERKQAAVTAVLATLDETAQADSKTSTPEEFYAVFERHYTGDAGELPKRRLGKALRKLSESKRRDDIRRKLEKHNTALERKLSTSSTATTASTASGTKSSASSTTLVDSDDDEKEGKKSEDSDGAPLELTWTWSALGEAF